MNKQLEQICGYILLELTQLDFRREAIEKNPNLSRSSRFRLLREIELQKEAIMRISKIIIDLK